jgi:hypothetical protein
MLKPFERLINDPEWKEVEDVVEEEISRLLDIRNIDTSKNSEELRIEIVARIRAGESLLDFYRKYKFTQKKLPDVQFDFK